MRQCPVLSPAEVEHLIALGNVIIIKDRRVLRLDDWIETHPGGHLVISHMVGRDATNEMNVYHSAKTLQTMARYQIGWIDAPWTNFTPPIRGGVFRKLSPAIVVDGHRHEIVNSKDSAPLVAYAPTLEIPDVVWSNAAPEPCLPSKLRERCLVEASDRENHTSDATLTSSCDVKSSQSSIHSTSSINDDADRMLQKEIDEGMKEYPSLDAVTQRNIVMKYEALHQRIKAEGFYNCPYSEYAKEMLRYSSLFILFLTALHFGWYITSAAFLGLFWHQIMFTAHDAGHRGITHNFVVDTLIGMFIADFCCGLSIGWWKSSHNVHHLVTNQPEHDPDIQNVPLFATSISYFKSLHSTYYNFTFIWDAFADKAVQYQSYTYYPVMAIARFNLYLLSALHLLSPRSQKKGSAAWIRPTELAFMVCYWYLFGYRLLWLTLPSWRIRIAFVLVSHIITMPLHVQITLSHWGMPTSDFGEAESFPQRQLRTTMDVACPAWLDFVHGGLQFQACHHLFPQVPRHNLRRLQALVREFCRDTCIPYRILGFVEGNKVVLGRLQEVGRQVDFLVRCQKFMAETGESGLH